MRLERDRRSIGQLVGLVLACLLVSFTIFQTGCSLAPLDEQESLKQTQIRETEIEINVKQTLLALQHNDQLVQQTIQAQQVVLNAQATLLNPSGAPVSAPTIPPTGAPTPPPTPGEAGLPTPTLVPPAPPTRAPLNPDQLAERMKSASILLYEDMTTRLDTVRFIKPVLDQMGLKYKDDGAAVGWLQDDIANGPGDGKPWDLVIIAAENKVKGSGEFFKYVQASLDKGSSVILETWFLDQSHSGLAMEMMDRCEIEYDGNWVKIAPARTILFIHDPSHPILNTPNSGISFSKSTSYWWDPNGKTSYDDGDLIKLKPGSRSKMLLGVMPNAPDSHGVLTICMDGRLILQTFSDHQFSMDNMSLLWENYIYNALKVRLEAVP